MGNPNLIPFLTKSAIWNIASSGKSYNYLKVIIWISTVDINFFGAQYLNKKFGFCYLLDCVVL